MKNKDLNIKIISAILLTLLFFSLGLNIILMENKVQLQYQIEARDSIIDNMRNLDSLINDSDIRNEKIVEKHIKDSGIIINEKEVSTEELVVFLNELLKENEKLRKMIFSINDSLSVYKAFYSLTKKNLGVDYTIDNDDSQRTLSLSIPKDSIRVYEILYNQAVKDYGFKYSWKQSNETIKISREFTKVDSAMIIYKYYYDKLSKNEKGEWIIILPEKQK